MKTGIELITEERREQVEKHGWKIETDACYVNEELLRAALYCIEPSMFHWPENWDVRYRDKIVLNDRISQLKKAGAFIAAEIDRISNK